MLYLVLAYLLISLISLLAGIIFYDFLFPPKEPDSSHKPLLFYVITGFILLTGLTQWVVLFFPVKSITIFFVLLPVIVI
jgi:hypothetical protein